MRCCNFLKTFIGGRCPSDSSRIVGTSKPPSKPLGKVFVNIPEVHTSGSYWVEHWSSEDGSRHMERSRHAYVEVWRSIQDCLPLLIISLCIWSNSVDTLRQKRSCCKFKNGSAIRLRRWDAWRGSIAKREINPRRARNCLQSCVLFLGTYG